MVPDKKSKDNRWMLYSAAIIFTSLLVQYYVTQCGLLQTYDSGEYLSAARSFSTHHVFTGSDGEPLVFWPPLFPLILSFFSNPESAMIWINLVLSGLIGVMVARLASEHLTDLWIRTGFVAAYMLGVHQLLISVFLWSELIFVLLLLSFVDQVMRVARRREASDRLERSDASTSRQTALSGLTATFLLGFLLCLQRNAGLFIVPAAAAWLLLRNRDIVKSTTKALIILLSIVGGVWWNATNMFGSNSTKFNDYEYFSSFVSNATVVTDGIAQSILPSPILSIPIAVMIFALPIVLILLKRKLSDPFLLMALVCCFYLAGMAIVFEHDREQADRFAAVILPLVLLMIFRVIDEFYKEASRQVRIIVLVAMIAWLVYPLARTVRNAVQWHEASCSVPEVDS